METGPGFRRGLCRQPFVEIVLPEINDLELVFLPSGRRSNRNRLRLRVPRPIIYQSLIRDCTGFMKIRFTTSGHIHEHVHRNGETRQVVLLNLDEAVAVAMSPSLPWWR